jgi:sarcosine oxidase
MAHADIAVVGLGVVGSAVLMHLARAGIPAIGIDRFSPPHTMGSSHGETRITRLAVGEGDAYAPLVRRSHAIWQQLEEATGERLLLQTGGLVMAPRDGAALHHGTDNFVQRSVDVARQHSIRHELLEAAEIARRFPQFQLRGDEIAYFEPSAGMLFPERCVAAQLGQAQAHGATIVTDEPVLDIATTAHGVVLTTPHRRIAAGRVVVAAGAWLPRLLGGPFRQLARPFRQVLHWFPANDPSAYAPGNFPVFIWMHGDAAEDYLYGFPTAGTPEVKLATEQYAEPCDDPNAMAREIAPTEAEAMVRLHVRGRLAGLADRPSRSAACIYTVTPDAGFIVDTVPGAPSVLAVSACSGHGFKHATALGEAIAQQIAGRTPDIPLDPFTLARSGQPRFSAPVDHARAPDAAGRH